MALTQKGLLAGLGMWVLGLLCLAITPVEPVSAATPVKLKSFGPDGTEGTDFERVAAVAVDQATGSLYVLDSEANALYKFGPSGDPVAFGGSAAYIFDNRVEGVHPNTGRSASEIAVDSASHTIYVTEEHSIRAFQENGEPALFAAGPGAGTNEIAGFGEVFGVAVDPAGNLYVSDHTGSIAIYSSSGEFVTSFSPGLPSNLAVASDGTVYVIEGEVLRGFSPSTPSVEAGTTYEATSSIESRLGSFIEAVAWDPVDEDLFLLETNFTTSWVRQHDQSGTLIASFGEPETPGEVEALGDESQGVAVAAGGEPFYAGDAQSGVGGYSRVAIFAAEPIEVGPPTINSVSAADITADSATLRAAINPNTAATTYVFEYGPDDCAISVCAVVPLEGGNIDALHVPVEVSVPISGLEPATTYHFRVVAENEFGTIPADDHEFTTQPAGLGFHLSDSRAWEMVSPPNKGGGTLEGSAFGLVQAAANGEGIVFASLGSITAEPEGNRAIERSTILARRNSSGWHSKDVTPANSQVSQIAVGHQTEFSLFSRDLVRAVVEPRGETQLSPEASERTPYLWESTDPPLFTPLVTGKGEYANVPPDVRFGGVPSLPPPVQLRGADPEMSHIVIHSAVPLGAGLPGGALYQWSGGQLDPVSVLPDAEGGEVISAEWTGSGPGSVRHAVSDDGTRVFWSTGAIVETLDALYLRDTEAAETARLDVVQSDAGGSGQANPVFQGASADGTVAFFTDSQQLVKGASPSGRDLYRCEMPKGAPLSSGCTALTDISLPAVEGSENAEVLGMAPALSADGKRAYFVAKGVLDSRASSGGQNAVTGQPNLYFWEQGEDVRFIATLSKEDHGNWGRATGFTFFLSASGSPNGRYLAFVSQLSLTGYDNRNAGSGDPVPEVFQYDAMTDSVHCVSCDPTGALPMGSQERERPLVDPRRQWDGRWLAASLPEPTIWENSGPSLYQPRVALDNGRVFFNAIDDLVPSDSNRQWDVYQYEPVGTGSCDVSSGGASVIGSEGGCVALVSSGTGNKEAGFLDASVSGDDVFFLTPASLSARDEDAELDLYDARVNGMAEVAAPAIECIGQGCRSTQTPPLAELPASTTFRGSGNVKSCPKGKKKVHRRRGTRCVRRKHRSPKKHHRQTSHARGRGR